MDNIESQNHCKDCFFAPGSGDGKRTCLYSLKSCDSEDVACEHFKKERSEKEKNFFRK